MTSHLHHKGSEEAVISYHTSRHGGAKEIADLAAMKQLCRRENRFVGQESKE